MNTKTEQNNIKPPKLIPTFVSGFDTVANRFGLILFPLCLDLFLWLGPKVSANNLLRPLMDQSITLSLKYPSGMTELDKANQVILLDMLKSFNLSSLLRTYPVGIPSTMASMSPTETPWGSPVPYEIQSVLALLIFWLVLVLIGLIVGSLYFRQVARAVSTLNVPGNFQETFWSIGQVVWLTLAFILICAIVGIPSMIFVWIISIINPGIAQIAVLLAVPVFGWLFLPLVFSPHGIFILHQNALASILTSARLVRFFLPGSLIFILYIILLSEGLDLLWHVPPASSWMMLAGIFGHAFVTTSLLATSFVYYRDAMKWVQEVVQRSASPQRSSQI
jgi:hypothetical protein